MSVWERAKWRLQFFVMFGSQLFLSALFCPHRKHCLYQLYRRVSFYAILFLRGFALTPFENLHHVSNLQDNRFKTL